MEELIKNWLLDNREHILDSIVPLVNEFNKQLSDNESIWFAEINNQFLREVKQIIVVEASKSLGISALDMLQFLEAIDLENYINGIR